MLCFLKIEGKALTSKNIVPCFIVILVLLLWFDTKRAVSSTYACTLKTMFKAFECDLKQGGIGGCLALERKEPLNNAKIIILVKCKGNIL